MSIQTVLPPHSQENPFVIPSYPYGRLRCVKHVWLETKPKKGVRLMEQTQNPKNMRWNKPHASTYAEISGALYLDENGHVQWESVTGYTDLDKCKAFLETFGENAANHAALVNHIGRKEIYENEMDACEGGRPSYGSPEWKAAYGRAMAKMKAAGLLD